MAQLSNKNLAVLIDLQIRLEVPVKEQVKVKRVKKEKK